MKIKLKNNKVKHFSLEMVDEEVEESFLFDLSNAFTENDSNNFLVVFDIKISSEQGYKLSAEYVSKFETDEIISDDFKDSNFPVVNAPAIAYPFLRSFIGTVTLNAGYEPIILPTLNFVQMAKDRSN